MEIGDLITFVCSIRSLHEIMSIRAENGPYRPVVSALTQDDALTQADGLGERTDALTTGRQCAHPGRRTHDRPTAWVSAPTHSRQADSALTQDDALTTGRRPG